MADIQKLAQKREFFALSALHQREAETVMKLSRERVRNNYCYRQHCAAVQVGAPAGPLATPFCPKLL